VIWVGVIQGVGLGFLFTPLSVVSLSTLPPRVRPEGAGFYNLARNVGSSIGISIVSALLARATQANHADIAQYATAVNRQFGNPAVAQALNPATAAGRAALDALITRQAQVIAYVDDYKFLMIATLAVIPLLVVFKGRSEAPSGEHSTVAEI
jgi:MFS transporter, DHA2 family, multidrug resistance protein